MQQIPRCTKYYTKEENQQDFQPSEVGKEKDSVVQRSTSMGNGLYTQQTSNHENMAANIAELL